MMNQYEIDFKQGYDAADDKWLERIDKIKAEIRQEIAYKPMEMWDYRMGLTKSLDIIDKYISESEE